MHVITGIAVGLVVGFVEGVLIYLFPTEPHKISVTIAATLKGVLIGVLIGLTGWSGHILRAAILGGVFGLALNRVSMLPEGGCPPEERKYILRISVVSGALIAVLTVAL
jgi:hypothetical protein